MTAWSCILTVRRDFEAEDSEALMVAKGLAAELESLAGVPVRSTTVERWLADESVRVPPSDAQMSRGRSEWMVRGKLKRRVT